MTVQGADHETKFVLERTRAPFVAAWLEAQCQPDPEFPASIVSSIYFDTTDLRFLRDKDDSDFLKTKVRLRWYSDVDSERVIGGPFLEVKHKIGGQRDKHRIKVDLGHECLTGSSLDHQELGQVPLWLSTMGEALPRPLYPALEIRYRRDRFVEVGSNSRVCMDYEIRTPRINPRILPNGLLRDSLPMSVLELKGRETDLPVALQKAISFGCRKSSFSKYAACCASLLRS